MPPDSSSELVEYTVPENQPVSGQKKVLLIENSPLYHRFLSRKFEQMGYQAFMADSQDKAQALLKEHPFDLVCMSMYFEGGNAIDFVKEVKRHDPGIMVIMLTSDKNHSRRIRALRAGITEVIYKAGHKDIACRISICLKRAENSHLKGSRVLYVEDSLTQAVIHMQILEGMGLEVTHYRTAEAAMKHLAEKDTDLLITDVLLRGEGSGLTLLRYVRNLPGTKKRIPVLTITGYDDTARRQELFRAGTSDYIAKPVLEEELIIRVTNLISNKLLADKVEGQQAQLYDMAMRDHLTGCLNRHGFHELATKYLEKPNTHSNDLGFLLLDLDHFKHINDTHGHDVGDRVLSAVGKLLMSECRSEDMVARFGGEEFVILLPKCRKQTARNIAQRLRTKIEKLRPADLRVTVSIGVTQAPASCAPDLEIMFRTADKAVYRAKQRGRNCVSFRSYPSTQHAISQ